MTRDRAEYMREKREKDRAYAERQRGLNRTAREAERILASRHRDELETIKKELRVRDGLIGPGIDIEDLI